MDKSQEKKNYDEYGYVGGTMVQMKAEEYWELKSLVEAMLPQETKVFFPEKYSYVHRDTGEPIKTLNDKNRHLALKIVDAEATMDSKPTIQRTPMGMELLKMNLTLKRIHFNNVENGVAVHIATYQEQEALAEKERGITLKVAEDSQGDSGDEQK